MKKVGLISDTHGYFGTELKDFLKDVDVVLHCGDWGSIHTLEEVKNFKPVIGVYGNCDDQDIRLEVPLYQHFKLEDLDCANCAAKMEAAINKLDGVKKATVSFMTQKLTLEAEDERFDEVLQAALKCIAKVEPDCRVILK